MKVQDLVEHILHHVNAEVDSRDFSQAAGVSGRGRYVQKLLREFVADSRDLPTDEALGEISKSASLSPLQASLKRTLTNMQKDDGIRPQLALQAWVGKALEKSGKERGHA